MAGNVNSKKSSWPVTDPGVGKMEFEKQPFAEGSFRYVFRGFDGTEKKRVVIKTLKGNVPQIAQNIKPDIEVSRKSNEWAKAWNEQIVPLRLYSPRRNIRFCIPKITTILHGTTGQLIGGAGYTCKAGDIVSVEPYLEGAYVKFNNNVGYQINVDPVPNAFMHWAWEQSGHHFLICDLQGVTQTAEYTLTDPVIHSFDRRFAATRTDLGVYGMELVMGGHVCNVLCGLLQLAPYVGPGVQCAKPGSVFSFNLPLARQMQLLNAPAQSKHFHVIQEEEESETDTDSDDE